MINLERDRYNTKEKLLLKGYTHWIKIKYNNRPFCILFIAYINQIEWPLLLFSILKLFTDIPS